LDWDFIWGTLFVIFIVIPFIMVWVFAMMDLFGRHDMKGIVKVLWLFAIIFFPIIGTLLYFLLRPHNLPPAGMSAQHLPGPTGAAVAAETIARLDELKAKGSLTEAQYQALKAQALGEPTATG
jgi:hypothetical protein